jgi:hypothetical protein
LAFDPHAAAVLFGNGFNNRKPQAGTMLGAGFTRISQVIRFSFWENF